MAIETSYTVVYLDSADVMVTLRFIVPRASVCDGMTSEMDEVVLIEMSTALAQANQDMQEGTL